MNPIRSIAIILALAAVAPRAFAQEDVEAPGDEMAPPPPPGEEEPAPQVQVGAQSQAALAPPPQEPSQPQFDNALSPYGRWVYTPDFGRVWVPANVSPDWQPYTDGQWVDTSYGWSFSSTAPWGWATYHYGRWGWRSDTGWFWVPGYKWAPAWVSWRHVNGYAMWSPLGPRGYQYPRQWPGWVVVPHEHFTHPIRRYVVPRERVSVIVRTGRPVRGFGSVRYAQPVRVAPVRREPVRVHVDEHRR